MRKIFNVTGLCVKGKHYMVDTKDKINEILEMVERGDYFTIHRPRQVGKTTTLNILQNTLLAKGYLVIDTSFEGVGDNLFSSEGEFCNNILHIFAKSIKYSDKKTSELISKHNVNISSFTDLSDAITDIIVESGKKFVLQIDEVDKSSNSKIFLQFLGLLRNKYLAASAGKDITFQSVILAGLHDVRTLKLAIRDDSEAKFNSPWNISAKFNVDMNFNVEEIASMMVEYEHENNISFDVSAIAERIYQFTSGYPYLVSDICKTIDETLGAIWTEASVYSAVKIILNEKNTLFEGVIKNIENYEDIKAVVNELLVLGTAVSYNPFSYEKGLLHGIFKEDKGKLVIHNKMFEELIYNYMLEERHIRSMQVPVSSFEFGQFVTDGNLNMERILLKFQNFMFEEYRKADEKFYESQARLIFLSYIKPILNGKGFYFVEAQTRENKRLDVVVIYGSQKYVIELKIWNGEKYNENGREQLAEYLTIQGLQDGYLLVFNFNQNKEKSSTWLTVSDKNLFEVIL